jgi:hypothetical protein
VPAPNDVRNLVERFKNNREQYRSPKYNETQARQEFIDPFFKALGWDIYNEQGLAQDYRDVILEDSLEVEGATKAPDYAFRIGRERKFFVEAKKPAVNLETGIHAAFQVRRYAWSAKLPVSILTDFEEFAVYDCRVRPDKRDKASVGRVGLYSYLGYVEKWDEIAGVFSKDAVLRGSFDKYAEGVKGKRGTAEVDDAFLAEIEGWRLLLAKSIALRNEKLSVRELNYAVQMTLDRIIFLRICEDRGIEPYGQLQRAGEHEDIYLELRRLFQVADARYNSGLFHFKDEKGQSSEADALTLGLTVDDKALQSILKNLYAPDCPYVFSVIPTEILGQVYEQFLGKVIRLTAGHQAKVEEKPEVRKAGGVYYTPTYIVDYIVKNTLGKMLEGKTPADAARLKVLDPACGSGSFLLGAYQCLLDWHLRWYSEREPQKWAAGKAPAIFEARDGWQLTTAKKKEILLNNLHGVDIDAQAVEVTKLSLLLKVLEGENQETIGSQLALIKERVLPDLGDNIKCGNSLIGPDYWEGRMMVDEEERQRVNAFDWKAEFPQVFVQGGFDVVIGNPPYVRIQTLQETSPIDVEFYSQRYTAASKGNYDIYVVFVEKGLSLLSVQGRLGFILPHKFFNAQYGEPLRGVIANGRHLAKVVHFGDQQVFEGATTYTCLMFLDKAGDEEFEFEKVQDLGAWRSGTQILAILPRTIGSERVTETPWTFSVGKGVELVERFSIMPVKLKDIAQRIFQGFKTGADPVFILEERGNGTYYSNALTTEVLVERTFLRPLYKSGEMKRYSLNRNSRHVVFPYRDGKLVEWSELAAKAPKTAKYLESCKDILAKRENGRWIGSHWYCYSRNQALEIVSSPKILTADLNPFANYCYDASGEACFPGGAAGGYGIVLESGLYLYVLGLLNSKAVDFYHKTISTNFRGGWFGYDAKIIRNIPIRIIDFTDPADRARHDKMVSLVERMLVLHKQSPNTPQEKETLKREIEATDNQIDRLVYELYGLTEEEIRIVEGS